MSGSISTAALQRQTRELVGSVQTDDDSDEIEIIGDPGLKLVVNHREDQDNECSGYLEAQGPQHSIFITKLVLVRIRIEDFSVKITSKSICQFFYLKVHTYLQDSSSRTFSD
jgi:hypothetical protein